MPPSIPIPSITGGAATGYQDGQNTFGGTTVIQGGGNLFSSLAIVAGVIAFVVLWRKR